MRIIKQIGFNILVVLISLLLLCQSILPPADPIEQVRTYTRSIEFDFVQWTLDAILIKGQQSALSLPRYLPENQQKQFIQRCLDLVAQIDQTNHEIEVTYADPNLPDVKSRLGVLNQKLEQLISSQNIYGPVCESILQQQLNATLKDMGFTLAGQTIPPVLYHTTPLPYALIVSPRSIIRQDADISLHTDLTLPQMVALEQQVENNMDVSALVVRIGGIGVYPTMVLNSSDLPSLIDVVAHEWTHNYLTLRPLGLSYENSPQLRTMNETTATISGSEISDAVLKRFYPEYVTSAEPPSTSQPNPNPPPKPTPPPFNFNAEMHKTRVTADALLADHKIQEAEAYMETRRQLFWNNGYLIRRLNQAYFAFYGAYAAGPEGEAGSDPVGPAVRALRAKSTSLFDFINRISWMSSFDELKTAAGN